MNYREFFEQREREQLSLYAKCSADSVGRQTPITESNTRTCFSRDRDRIIHCKAFRRLKHKTQVFLSPAGDHYRTRLTHTLEVAQISRTISRCLRLNEDLTEAIALGHDLGHTPFGHAGERALNEICSFGFRHYEQSVRVCTRLENSGAGLNLTGEVLDGILCHTGGKDAMTLEGQVVRISDKIAYINHDIDDAIRAGLITQSCLPQKALTVLGANHSKRISTLVNGIINASLDKPKIAMQPEIYEAMQVLHQYLFDNIYKGSKAKTEEHKAQSLLKQLFTYFIQNPEKIPAEYNEIIKTDSLERAVCDYISGMSDVYALHVFQDIFMPRGWEYF